MNHPEIRRNFLIPGFFAQDGIVVLLLDQTITSVTWDKTRFSAALD